MAEAPDVEGMKQEIARLNKKVEELIKENQFLRNDNKRLREYAIDPNKDVGSPPEDDFRRHWEREDERRDP